MTFLYYYLGWTGTTGVASERISFVANQMLLRFEVPDEYLKLGHVGYKRSSVVAASIQFLESFFQFLSQTKLKEIM